MKKYLTIIILIFFSSISYSQILLKMLQKADNAYMYIGVDATDSLAQWKPLSGIGYSPLADSSKWTKSGGYLYPKDQTVKIGLGTSTPAQQLDMTGNLKMVTSTATSGNIYKGTTPFIHNFQHPTGGGAIPTGRNTFIGESAGNFTMGSTATSTLHSSYNVGIGYQALLLNTIGYRNIAIGSLALNSNTSGFGNVGLSYGALLSNTSGSYNTALGYQSLYNNTTANWNAAFGYNALLNLSSGAYNLAFGTNAGGNITSTIGNVLLGTNAGYQASTTAVGNYNIAIGYDAGRALGTGQRNILLGYDVELASPTTSDQLNIGNAIYATGLGTGSTPGASAAVGIGTSTPAKQLHTTGTVRFAGISSTSDTTAVMINSSGDLSKRTLNAAAFNGTIDSTTVVNSYGTIINESPANQFNIKVDSTKFATTYDLTQIADNDTQDLSIDSTGRVFTISLTDGGSVKFEDKDTDTNTTYSNGYGLDLSGTTFSVDTSKLATQYDLTQIEDENTTYTAGYGLDLDGTTFSNTRYWNSQDTLKTTLSGLVKATSGVLSAITDNSSDWNMAYGWGNHASAGYLTSFTETDPIFGAHTAKNIANGSGFLKNNGIGTWTYDNSTYLTSEIDGSVTNEIQNLSYTASTRVLAIDGTGSTDATLPTFATNSTNAGLVNGSNSATSNFLRGDNTWQAVDISNTNEIELPTQTGNNGKYLTTNGTAPSWATISALTGSGTAGHIPYFSSGSALTSNANLFWDAANYRLGIGTATPSNQFHVYKSGAALGLIEGTTVGAMEVKGGDYSGYTLSNGTGNYYIQYKVGANDGLKIYPDQDQSTMPVRFQTYQYADRFVINPSANTIGVYNGTSIVTGSDGTYLKRTASGYDWATPVSTPLPSVDKYRNGGPVTEQTINTPTSFTKIQFDEAVINNTMVSCNTTNYNFTVGTNGYYEVNCVFNLQTNVGGTSANPIFQFYNGESGIGIQYDQVTHTYNPIIVNITETFELTNTSVISLRAKTSGATGIKIQDFTITVKRVY